MMPAQTMRCGRLFVVPLLLGLAGAARAEETRMVPVTVDGERVRLYALSHSAENFLAFQAAGGRSTFHALMPAIPQGGHRIISHPRRWQSLLDEYLQRQGLARPVN